MNSNSETQNKKGTWGQALVTFLFPILLVLTLRWALVEPFVIPSGSMIPNLLVHDHVLVKKYSYGLRVPFLNSWLFQWHHPQRGDIAVFKYPENPDVFYIKRVIGLPGDTVSVNSGRITVNGVEWKLTPQPEVVEADVWSRFNYYLEDNTQVKYQVRFLQPESTMDPQVFKVPVGNYFFMGDNRDQSSDSRTWGFVKNDYLVGQAFVIWLSCHSTLPTMSFVCDPSQIRWERIFKSL